MFTYDPFIIGAWACARNKKQNKKKSVIKISNCTVYTFFLWMCVRMSVDGCIFCWGPKKNSTLIKKKKRRGERTRNWTPDKISTLYLIVLKGVFGRKLLIHSGKKKTLFFRFGWNYPSVFFFLLDVSPTQFFVNVFFFFFFSCFFFLKIFFFYLI